MTKSLSSNLYKGVTPISLGGTGSTTSAAALTALGAQPLLSSSNLKTLNNSSLLTPVAFQFGNLIPTAIKTSNYTAVSNDLIRCNSTSGIFTITLPTTPADGTIIGILDVYGTFNTTPVTVISSGCTIESDTSVILNVSNIYISIIYNSFNNNWQILKNKSTIWFKAPNPPTAISATMVNTTATITYTAPVITDGSIITAYTATSTPGNLTGTGTGSISVAGLSYNTSYTFTVTASIGTNTTSVPSTASNAVSVVAPNAPSIGTVTVSVQTITIPIIAPLINGGGTITQYSVTSTPTGLTGTLNQAANGNIIITATPAQTNISYTFTATATNGAGTSPASSASNAVTPTLPPATSVEYLVVAGGGGGGGGTGAGGGGGGYRTASNFAVVANTWYNVTIGGGGGGGSGFSGSGGGRGGNGGDSAFATIVSTGGGGGGSNSLAGAAGGSAGGSGWGASAVQPYPTGQGNAGGAGASSLQGYGGGGGGGAGGAGDTGSGAGTGNGGSGNASSITGSSVTYAGGGGGGGYSYNGGLGGTGGGGNGTKTSTLAANATGVYNLGGGGGAMGNNGGAGAAGGAGIVIIRHSTSFRTASTAGSPTITSVGGYTIYRFTGSGNISF